MSISTDKKQARVSRAIDRQAEHADTKAQQRAEVDRPIFGDAPTDDGALDAAKTNSQNRGTTRRLARDEIVTEPVQPNHAATSEGSCERIATVEAGVPPTEQMQTGDETVTLESDSKSASQPILWGTEYPRRQIWVAATHGDWKSVQEMLRRDPTLITITGGGTIAGIEGVDDQTLLHLAACNRDNPCISIMECLIDHGADVHKRDSNGWQAIHYAAWGSPDVAIVKFLVAQGADVHSQDNAGMTPLHHTASNSSNVAILESLVTQGADIHARDNEGWTPLHYASYGNSVVAISEFFVGRGADIHARDFQGVTPLHLAVFQSPNIAVMAYLLSVGADINAKTNGGHTPLHAALSSKNLSLMVLQYLLQRGADINAKDEDGETPLHVAVSCRASREVHLHLILNGADVRALDNKGRKPSDLFDFSELVKNWEFCVLWLLHDPELVNIRREDGFTLLHHYANTSKVGAMAFVLERGINVNVLDDCGRTPLHVAVGLCHYNTSLHFLISQGADASIKDHQGKTPLDCAAGFGLPVDEFTKSLLNRNTSLVSELAVSNR